MEVGTVLMDPVTGLKLLVVEQPSVLLRPSDILANGSPLSEEVLTPASLSTERMQLTTDPGMRG